MTTVRALVSGWALGDPELRDDHLKLCCLWYDEVLYEPLRPTGSREYLLRLFGEVSERDFRDLTDVLIPVGQRVPHSVRGTSFDRLPLGYPRWGDRQENYDYPEPQHAHEAAHNALLRMIEREQGVAKFVDGYDVQQAEGRARVAVDAVELWDRVNREVPCMLQTTKDEKTALTVATNFGAIEGEVHDAIELFGQVVPALTRVSWADIAELRRNGGYQSLRTKLEQASSFGGGDIERAKQRFAEIEDATTAEIMERYRPRVRRVAVEALLANLPGFAVNPFSLYFGVRDTVKEAKKKRDASWLYLLRDLQATASTPGSTTADQPL